MINATIVIYTQEDCTLCTNLKRVLETKKIKYEEVQSQDMLNRLGNQYKILSAPIVEVINTDTADKKFYSYSAFISGPIQTIRK